MDNGLPRGYYRNKVSGGVESLPWPEKLEDLPPSLGFQIIRWAEEHLIHHLTGDPWRFSVLQKRFLVLWYAVGPDGKWLYRSGVMRLAKGAGKDPFLGAMADIECMGPVKFSHFDVVTGRPVGKPHRMSLVLLAANSEAQAKEVLLVANAMVSDRLKQLVGFTAGKLGSATASGSRIKLSVSSVKSSEGDPATAVFLNESHHMTTASGGKGVAEVARRNAAKNPGGQARVMEATNAHRPSGDSVAEDTYLSWQAQVAGKTRRQDILYCSVEADPSLSFVDPDQAEQILKQAYFYSPWIDKDRILGEVEDLRTSPGDSIRFYANGLAAAETAWVDPSSWDKGTMAGEYLHPEDAISLALDCSKSGDSTALVVTRIKDGFPFLLGIWEKPHGSKNWLVPREEVDMVLCHTMDTHNVVWLGVDPSPSMETDTLEYWGYLMEKWRIAYGDKMPVRASNRDAIGFDMRLSADGGHTRLKLFTEMAMKVAHRIDSDFNFPHDDNPVLKLHVGNCRRRPNQWGISIGKESRDSSKKIDAAAAMIIALVGRDMYINSGKQIEPGVSYFV